MKDKFTKAEHDEYYSLSLAVRDRIIDRWFSTQKRYYQENCKRVYYLSLEFLLGRMLENNVINLGIEDLVLYDFKKKNKKMIISILSDTVESLIGAIYIDGGYKSSFLFIKKFWLSYLDIDVSKTLDPKTELQEISQQKEKKLPEYKIIKKRGPSHSPLFTVSLKVLNIKKINANGTSIREAEKKAAAEALKIIYEKKNT